MQNTSTMVGKSLTPWNIFIPHQALHETSGYLVGTTYPDANTVCVHGLLSGESASEDNDVVGYFEQIGDPLQQPQKQCFDLWVNLKYDALGHTVHCSLEAHSPLNSETHTGVCILFDPLEVNFSYILHQSSNAVEKERQDLSYSIRSKRGSEVYSEFKNKADKSFVTVSEINESVSKDKERCLNTAVRVQETRNVLTLLARNAQQQQTNVRRNVKVFHGSCGSLSSRMFGWLTGLLTLILLLLLWGVCLAGHVVNIAMNCASWCCSSLPRLLQTPSIILHLQTRGSRYKAALSLDRQDRFNRFVLFNCCGQQLVDTCLGVSLIWLVLHYDLAGQISSYALDWADDVARELTSLVQWLMGAPAGLKLNAQLTKFLGHFFIYHIYLWTGYLTLLKNMMPSVILFCSCTGVLGVSAQMSLVQDVLSMLTLHIYCFYVYAAKIFHLQVYALRSLWRLFRGKKWNVLRARVDSASYNTDELFVGTLLFTILLFLLPTTALYYAVFTLLRLMELAVQGILSRIVAFVTSAPVFTIVLRLVAQKLVAGSAVFRVSHMPEGLNCLVLNMQTCPIPFHQLTKLTAPLLSTQTASVYTWGQFLSHLATGKLIYPWVDVNNEDETKKTE